MATATPPSQISHESETAQLREEVRQTLDGLTGSRLTSARDFLKWLEQLDDEAEIEAFSRNKKLQKKLDEQRRLVDQGKGVDWRKVRDDV